MSQNNSIGISVCVPGSARFRADTASKSVGMSSDLSK